MNVLIRQDILNNLKPFENNSKRNLNGYIFSTKKTIQNIINQTNQIHSSNDSSIKIENSELENNINQKELETFILKKIINNPGIKEVDLSEIINNKNIHTHIYNILGRNFPLLEVSRLIPGQKIVDITFLGVKDLNDTIGKETVDLFIGKFKNIINTNFDKIIAGEKPGRIIRNEYKHLTFSIIKELNISKKIFAGETSKEELINQIFSNISDKELNEVLVESGKINLTREDIKLLIEKYFDFGIGASIVTDGTNEGKENTLYKAVRASRKKADLNDLGENLNFDFNKVKDNALNALLIESNIIKNYPGVKFAHDGITFDIVVNGKISPLLLKYVRKNQNIKVGNDSKTLKNEIGKYITHLTNGFDFISSKINENDFDNIEKINKQISSGKIDVNLFLNNHKGTLTKVALNILSKGKQLLKMFIDIVDMGIMNLNDFRNLAGKVVSGEITEENMGDLLKAGKPATKKFQKLTKNIRIFSPEAQISLYGGDEAYIFIPGKTEKNKDEIIKEISKNLDDLILKGRISTSFVKDDENIYNTLDNITNINKFFEKVIEQTIILNTLEKEPGVTSLNIIDNKLNLINENLTYFLNLIKAKIKNEDIITLTISNKPIKQELEYEIVDENGNIINGILNIELINKNNLITIQIT